MVRGRKSQWDKPIQNILESGSHREEINSSIKLLANATPEEVELKKREVINSKKALFKLAENEGRGLTKEEWYQKKIYDGLIKKLKLLKEYRKFDAPDELILDVELKDIPQDKLWEQICNITKIVEDTSDISKIKELEKHLHKLEKEYFKRTNLSKEKQEIQIEDIVLVEDEEGTVLKVYAPVIYTDDEIIDTGEVISSRNDTTQSPIGEDHKPSTVDEFFEKLGKPITEESIKEQISKEQEAKKKKFEKNRRSITYDGWDYSKE
jgi:hypothetical protein